MNNKGGNTDDDVTETWIAACEEVLAGRAEDQATPTDWAKIRDVVIKDMALTVVA